MCLLFFKNVSQIADTKKFKTKAYFVSLLTPIHSEVLYSYNFTNSEYIGKKHKNLVLF